MISFPHFLIACSIVSASLKAQSFKDEQMKYPRVKTAFVEKSGVVDSLLHQHRIDKNTMMIFLRGLKSERRLELWGKNTIENSYQLMRMYPFCAVSGDLGPKRKEGDGQIPEGVYSINHFNPQSNFYLSLGINYPNRSDAAQGVKGKLGGAIYIHGDCVTIGCIPITDDLIKELYVFAVEARNSGQQEIPVHIFPSVLDDVRLEALLRSPEYGGKHDTFWKNLSVVYQYFERTKTLPSVSIDRNGKYQIN